MDGWWDNQSICTGLILPLHVPKNLTLRTCTGGKIEMYPNHCHVSISVILVLGFVLLVEFM